MQDDICCAESLRLRTGAVTRGSGNTDADNKGMAMELTDADSMRVEKTPAPLRQQVVDSLRSAITGGRFRPGDRLIERQLCDATGVSRTLVREALRQLEAEGLVKVLPNRGPVVASIELDEAMAIYQVRGVLEALASKLFTELADSDQMARLQAGARDFATACDAGDTPAAARGKDAMYRALFDGCGNAVLQAQLNQLFARTSLLRAVTLAAPDRLAASRREVGALVDALVARDGERAWNASLDHVRSAAAVLSGLMAAPADTKAGPR